LNWIESNRIKQTQRRRKPSKDKRQRRQWRKKHKHDKYSKRTAAAGQAPPWCDDEQSSKDSEAGRNQYKQKAAADMMPAAAR
jgi:hypothetical protein